MKRLVFIGSHLGYPMDRTPLGGGAMVGMNLLRAWAKSGEFEITALGAGAQSPDEGVDYVRLCGRSEDAAPDLVRFSEMAYAKFCRRFEAESARWLLERAERFAPESTAVVINDISEAPDLAALRRAGYRPATIWHVDVADYFCRIYLGGYIPTRVAVGCYERLAAAGASASVPDVLRLVFDKQRRAVACSERMIFPSRAMADVARSAYARIPSLAEEFNRRARVVPWGAWDEDEGAEDKAARPADVRALKERYQIGSRSLVLMTLSRLAPEKGVHLLIEALSRLERADDFSKRDVCLFVCGEAAFMKGAAYAKRLHAAARKLKRARVFFPGYLGPREKTAFFSLADLFVSPSTHESYGLNAMEALANGLPVLALDHYGSRDWPQDAFAKVVSPGTLGGAPAALADGLRNIANDESALAEMGRKAEAFAAARPFSAAARAVSGEAFSALEARTAEPALR